MSGIFFDLPSVRFLRRSRFVEAMMRTFASLLRRGLSAPACAWRQVYFRLDEAEFSAASQSACNLFDWTLGNSSRAADGVPNVFGALRPFNNWVKLKDYYELLFIRETPAPFAWRHPTQGQRRALSASATTSEKSKKDVLGAGGRVFWKRRRCKEEVSGRAQWHAAFAPAAKTGGRRSHVAAPLCRQPLFRCHRERSL
jgi:hypothetical protein